MKLAKGTVVFVLALCIFVGCAFLGTSFAQTPPEAPDVEIVTERLLFTRGPNGPRLLHMVQLLNVGPRPAEQIPLSVPTGALWLDVPEELEPGENVIVDPRPLAPGEARQYVFTYDLPWQRLPMTVRRPLFYPTEVMELWAETDALTLRGVNVRPVAEEDIGGIRFTVFVMTDVPPHPQWQVLLETPNAPGARVSPLERIGQRSDPFDIVRAHPLPGAILVVVALLVIGYVISRRKQNFDVGAPLTGEQSVAGAPRRLDERTGEIVRLKEAIVQVDVAYQNGEMDEDVYAERRASLKSELLQLLDAVKGGGSRL